MVGVKVWNFYKGFRWKLRRSLNLPWTWGSKHVKCWKSMSWNKLQLRLWIWPLGRGHLLRLATRPPTKVRKRLTARPPEGGRRTRPVHCHRPRPAPPRPRPPTKVTKAIRRNYLHHSKRIGICRVCRDSKWNMTKSNGDDCRYSK